MENIDKYFSVRKAINDETRERIDVILFDFDSNGNGPIVRNPFLIYYSVLGGSTLPYLLKSAMSFDGKRFYEVQAVSENGDVGEEKSFIIKDPFRLVRHSNEWHLLYEKEFNLIYTLENDDRIYDKEEEVSKEDSGSLKAEVLEPSLRIAFSDERVVDLFTMRDIDFLKRSKPHRDVILDMLNEYFSKPHAVTPFSEQLKHFATSSHQGIVTTSFLSILADEEDWKSFKNIDILLYQFSDEVQLVAIGGRNDGKFDVYRFVTTRDISAMFEIYDVLVGIDAGFTTE